MDDLQFRRSILANPKYRDDAINDAINEDPAKQKFANDIDMFLSYIEQDNTMFTSYLIPFLHM